MKKIILAYILAATATTVFADGRDHGRHGHNNQHYPRPIVRHDDGMNWLVPAIIGGVVMYSVTRPQAETNTNTVVIQNNCTPWTEVQNPNGTITRTRTCTQ